MVNQLFVALVPRAVGVAALLALAVTPVAAATPANAPAVHPGAPPARANARLSGFTVLHSFAGPEGANPTGQLLVDSSYHLFGSTENGGANSLGNVYETTTAGATFSVLHSFAGTDGASPEGGPFNTFENIYYKGLLYGVTENGGAFGEGAVYAINPSNGNTTIVHSFSGTGTDGAYPVGRLILFTDGALYGTTTSGGADGEGTIYQISSKSGFQSVYSFTGLTDGAIPQGGLQVATSGCRVSPYLYGVTSSGGNFSSGTIYAFKPGTGVATGVYSFTGGNDGGAPIGDLIPDPSGNVYGVTSSGGKGQVGTLFAYSPNKAKLSTLHSFVTTSSFTNPFGSVPAAGLNFSVRTGALYGVTLTGGAYDDGTVFRLFRGSFVVLHSFDGADGLSPEGQVLPLPDGNVYGTTNGGGANGLGVLFGLPD